MVIISVDGLAITDGKPASEESGGFLLEPYRTVIIPGWMIDNTKVAKFQFGDKKSSYASAIGSDDGNCGVIGVMVFDEKYVPPVKHTAFRGIQASGGAFAKGGLLGSVSGSSGPSYASGSTLGGGMLDSYASTNSASLNNLGTEFGQSQEFKTTEVEFEKGHHHSTFAIYYDDAKGLKARGIVVSSGIKSPPNPFPASKSGCTPPPGWYSR